MTRQQPGFSQKYASPKNIDNRLSVFIFNKSTSSPKIFSVSRKLNTTLYSTCPSGVIHGLFFLGKN